jgi:hypothetical protein
LLGSIGGIVLLVGGGFALDSRAFAGNLIAGVADIIASALIAVFIVDRLVAADRRTRWRAVSEGTAETLEAAIVRAALSLYVRLPAPRPSGTDPFTMAQVGELVPALRRLGAALRAEGASPLARAPVGSDVIRGVGPHARLIAEVVLPRLLLVGSEPELVASIVALERSVGQLEYDVWMEESFGLPVGVVFEDMARIVDGLRAIAEVVQQDVEDPVYSVSRGALLDKRSADEGRLRRALGTASAAIFRR